MGVLEKNFVTVGGGIHHKIGGFFHCAMHLDVFGWGVKKKFVTVGGGIHHKIYELSTLNPKRGGIFHDAMHLDIFGWWF